MLRIDKDVWCYTENPSVANAIVSKLKEMGISYEIETKNVSYDDVSDTWDTKTQISFSCSDTDYQTIKEYIDTME